MIIYKSKNDVTSQLSHMESDINMCVRVCVCTFLRVNYLNCSRCQVNSYPTAILNLPHLKVQYTHFLSHINNIKADSHAGVVDVI